MRSIEQPQDFEHYYAQSNLPIVLDFYTDTCNPCKSLMPILDKLSREYESDVVFLKTKANENVVLAKELGVVSVPTLIFVNKDREIERYLDQSSDTSQKRGEALSVAALDRTKSQK